MRYLAVGQARTGSAQERATWFRVSVWNRLAESCNQSLAKGQRVLVVGEIEKSNIWTDREGKPRVDLRVRVLTVRFLTPAAGSSAAEDQAGVPSQIFI